MNSTDPDIFQPIEHHMRNVIILEKHLLVLVLAFTVLGCVPENERGSDGKAGAESKTEFVDRPVLDAIHRDIVAGDYGLIDRFLVIQRMEYS